MNRALGLVAAVTLSLALAGCTGGTPSSGGDGSANEIRYLIAQPETPEQLELIKADLQKFQSQSGITIDLEALPNDNLRTVLQTQLRSGEGPDVFDYDTGPAFTGVLAKAGLLFDLTDAYRSRNWKIYPFAKERVTFGGRTLGIPANLGVLGIFYNKDIYARLGIAEPGNLNALGKAAEQIKAAGITPFAVADKEGWEGGHLLSMALSSRVGPDKMNDLLTGKQSWSSPDVVAALQTWAEFNRNGYLTKSPTAVAFDNANGLFFSSKAAMVPTGSWMVPSIQKNAKFETGFIPFPAEHSRGIFSGGLGSGTFISAKTTKTDAALRFLDYLQSPERGRWQVENLQTVPAYPVDTTGIRVAPLFAQVLDGTGQLSKRTGDFGFNIDVLTTDTFNTAMWGRHPRNLLRTANTGAGRAQPPVRIPIRIVTDVVRELDRGRRCQRRRRTMRRTRFCGVLVRWVWGRNERSSCRSARARGTCRPRVPRSATRPRTFWCRVIGHPSAASRGERAE